MLLANGHPYARHYPVAVVWSEARIVRQRDARRMQHEALILQTVVASVMSEGGGKELIKLLKKIDDVG